MDKFMKKVEGLFHPHWEDIKIIDSSKLKTLLRTQKMLLLRLLEEHPYKQLPLQEAWEKDLLRELYGEGK